VAQIPDALLGAIGGIIRGVGGIVSGIINGNEEREALNAERLELLEAAGVDQQTLELLTTAPFLAEMGQLGLNRDQFLELARDASRLDQDAEPFLYAMDAAAAFGLQGADAMAFIAEAREAFANDAEAMYRLHNSLINLDAYSYDLEAGDDLSGLADTFSSVQWLLEQNFPELATRFHTNDRSVQDINVGYYNVG
jgi:hypothetical protein